MKVYEGYQRINLAQSVIAGDRWGFRFKSDGDDRIPIKYYDDTSSISHEFNYQVSAGMGSQIFLSSAQVSYKKFTIRPCLCSCNNLLLIEILGLRFCLNFMTVEFALRLFIRLSYN